MDGYRVGSITLAELPCWFRLTGKPGDGEHVNLFFWQNILSPHQSATLRALAEIGHTVSLIVEQSALPERHALGWVPPNFGPVHITVSPDQATITAMLEDGAVHGAYHVVSGLRSTPLAYTVLQHCRAKQLPVGLLCEAGDPRGIYGVLRRVLYTGEAFGWRHIVNYVLAMGQLGVDWYRQAGYPRNRIFPYAYTVESPPPCSSSPSENETVQLMYVGAFIPRKGVDLLLKALSRFTHLPWTLTLIGDGPARPAWLRQAARGGIAERLILPGVLPMSSITSHMARADLLVLPSRFDGWGAVVNEALMSGVPVLCSTRCGAADLLRTAYLGETFQAAAVSSLACALAARIARGPIMSSERKQIQQWARCLTGESLAHYLLAILRHVYMEDPAPSPPWLSGARVASLLHTEGGE